MTIKKNIKLDIILIYFNFISYSLRVYWEAHSNEFLVDLRHS